MSITPYLDEFDADPETKRGATQGETTREAAMAAFAKSWRRE